MKILAALFALATVALLAYAVAQPPRDAYNPAEYARLEAEAERYRLQMERDAALAPLVTAAGAAWLVLPLVAGGAGLAIATAWGSVALVRFRRERWPRRGDGVLPVLCYDQEAARAALAGYHATERARASIQPSPVTYSPTVTFAPHDTYSPHSELDYRADSGRAALLPADEPAAGPGLPGVTDLASLAFRPSLESILLALGDGGERVTVSAKALCHVALVGSTGGGKSNLIRLLLPQLQACGARVVLADPHFAPVDLETGEDWRPIAARLHMAPAVAPGEIAALLAYLTDELERRLELRRAGTRWGPPLFLALDELPVIADTVPGAVDELGRLLREGRKVSLYSVGASQSMLVKVIGGDSSAREAYRTAFYVGGDLRSATVLLDLAQRDIAEGALGQGVAYLRSRATSPARLVRVPLASNAAVAGLLDVGSGCQDDGADAPEEPAGKPDGSQMDAKSNQATRSSIRPEAARALELFREGRDLPEIVKELRGVKSSQGRAYQDASREVQALLREAL
jgi:hypothetical protein